MQWDWSPNGAGLDQPWKVTELELGISKIETNQAPGDSPETEYVVFFDTMRITVFSET